MTRDELLEYSEAGCETIGEVGQMVNGEAYGSFEVDDNDEREIYIPDGGDKIG